MATARLACPWTPEFGLTWVITAVAAFTVNPFTREATSVPVVTVTVRAPVVALAAIVMLAVRVVALVTVTVFTVMPAPKLT